VSCDEEFSPQKYAASFGIDLPDDRVKEVILDELSFYSTQTSWARGVPQPRSVRPKKLLAAVHYVPSYLSPDQRTERLCALYAESLNSEAEPVMEKVLDREGLGSRKMMIMRLLDPMPSGTGLDPADLYDGLLHGPM